MMMVPQSGKVATVRWNPPTVGSHSGFKLKVGNLAAFCISMTYIAIAICDGVCEHHCKSYCQVIPISEPGTTIRNIVIRETRSKMLQ